MRTERIHLINLRKAKRSRYTPKQSTTHLDGSRMSKKGRGDSLKISYRLSDRNSYHLFSSKPALQGLNSLAIAASVFEIEKVIRTRRVIRADLPIYCSKELRYDLDKLRGIIQELLLHTLVKDMEISFRETSLNKKKSHIDAPPLNPVQNLCLFSGGIDSYAGILIAKQKLGDVQGLFCGHSDQSKIIHIVGKIRKKLLKQDGIVVHKLNVPSIGAQGYAQLRGFLYFLSAAAWMHLLKAERLVVTECGPTMYQPRFAPFDAVTMTTHPFVLKQANQVINILLKRKIEILTPFEDLTKAEVMAISPKKERLRRTHSCISQRFGTHDGTCYGCVIRNLGAIATGIKDVRYARNPIADRNAEAGNLLSLLVYCQEILTQYHEMDDYETENIEIYGKHDLFRRFALDNFAAIHRLVKEGRRVRRDVRNLYEEVKASIGPHVFDTRLRDLRKARFAVAF